MEEKTINFGEALADYVSGLDYGSIIHYQEIERITKQRRGAEKYYRYIAKAKRILEDRGKMIRSIGRGDYQILYPGDYSGAYAREVRLARKKIRHGGRIIRGAPISAMSTQELQEFNRVQDFHTSLEARISGAYVTVKRLIGRNNHPLSPDNVQKGVTTTQ